MFGKNPGTADSDVNPLAPFIEWLPIDCNVSDASLAECLERMGPGRCREYTLYCGQRAFADITFYMKTARWDQRSPFHPQVNVKVEPLAKPNEWVLVGGNKRVGSHGA